MQTITDPNYFGTGMLVKFRGDDREYRVIRSIPIRKIITVENTRSGSHSNRLMNNVTHIKRVEVLVRIP